MNDEIDRTAERVPQALDRELRLIREAILMVAGGMAPRVTVGGLSLGAVLLESAQTLARQSGVRIVPAWSADGHEVDYAVEPMDADREIK